MGRETTLRETTLRGTPVIDTGKWQQGDFEPEASGPLKGITVVDLSRLVAGNMTSLQLADFGADVIKVEPLPAGDPLRAWKQQGVETYWKVYGRNKRSLALDFRQDGAIDLLRRLLVEADVLIESFRPGTLEDMGLGPTVLADEFPQLITLRVSGFGQTGPYGSRPGFGTLVEGMSGFAARTGEPGGGPLLPPLALADMIAGLYGSNAIMMALRHRDQTGTGQVVDLALLDAMVSVLGPEPLDLAITGRTKPRVGNGSNTSSPRNAYRTQDGHYICVSGSMQSAAARLFTAIGRDDMNQDPRYSTNQARIERRDEVDAIVAEWIGNRSRESVMETFVAEGITAAPIYDAFDAADDPHFIEREIHVTMPDDELGASIMHRPVPRLSDSPGTLRRAAPTIGQDSIDILEGCGWDAVEIDALIARGLVQSSALHESLAALSSCAQATHVSHSLLYNPEQEQLT